MITILKYPELTSGVLLPSPEWSDSKSLNNAVKIHRSLNGAYWTYIKTSDIVQLDFQLTLTDVKAEELIAYYMANAGQLFTLAWLSTYLGTFVQGALVLENNRRGATGCTQETVSCSFAFIGVEQ